MKFNELIITRQSDRKYISKPVSREIINKCIEAARLAPSASNSQPWTFVVVDDSEIKDKVAIKTFGPLKSFNRFVLKAPVIIAIVLEKPKNNNRAGRKN